MKSKAISSASRKMCKTVELRTKKVMALVDTGSQFNIINERVHEKIGSPVLLKSTLCFSGFGRSKVEPKGYFEDIILIDGECFAVSICVITDDEHGCRNWRAVIASWTQHQAKYYYRQEDARRHSAATNQCYGKWCSRYVTHCRERREEMEQLLEKYQQKTKSTDIKMTITLLNHQKIAARWPRRLPFPERKIVEEQVEQWIREGIVEPCSSEYASQVVVVRKHNETPRVCVDYRALNRIVNKDRYPLPLIEDILNRLQDARV